MDPLPHVTIRLGRCILAGPRSPAGTRDGWRRSLVAATALLASRAAGRLAAPTTHASGPQLLPITARAAHGASRPFLEVDDRTATLLACEHATTQSQHGYLPGVQRRGAGSMGTAHLVELGGGRPAAMAHPDALADGMARLEG